MTPRTYQEAVDAGRCYQVRFVSDFLDEWGRLIHTNLPYGLELPWADPPEEAAQWVRRQYPCADRRAVEVRRVLDWQCGATFLSEVVFVDSMTGETA